MFGQIAIGVAVEETQLHQVWPLFGDALQKRALLNAVAAPDAAEDQDFHRTPEAGNDFKLSGRQLGGVVNLVPAALLLGGAGGQIGDVGESLGEFFAEVGGGHGG